MPKKYIEDPALKEIENFLDRDKRNADAVYKAFSHLVDRGEVDSFCSRARFSFNIGRNCWNIEIRKVAEGRWRSELTLLNLQVRFLSAEASNIEQACEYLKNRLGELSNQFAQMRGE